MHEKVKFTQASKVEKMTASIFLWFFRIYMPMSGFGTKYVQ